MDGTTLASKLIYRPDNTCDVQRIVPRNHFVSVLIRFDVLQAIINTTSQIQIFGISMIQNACQNFCELAAIKFRWLPIPKDIPSLQRYEFFDEPDNQTFFKRRRQVGDQCALFD